MRIQVFLLVAIVLPGLAAHAAHGVSGSGQETVISPAPNPALHYFPGVGWPGSMSQYPVGRPAFDSVIVSDDVDLKYSGSALWTGMMDVALQSDFAFCAMTYGLAVLDISNPANPQWITSVFLPHGNALDVFVRGDYAYVADGVAGLQIVNLAEPRSPYLLSTHATPLYAHDVDVSGQYAFVAASTALQIIDVSDPSVPETTGDRPFMMEARGVAVSGQVAYVASGISGLKVVDFTDPAAPRLIESFPTENALEVVAISGIHAIAVSYQAILYSWDISDPARPLQMGAAAGFSAPLDMEIVGDSLYGAVGEQGLYIYDISDPAKPMHAGWIDSMSYAIGIGVQGPYAYMADPWEGLTIIELPAAGDPPRVKGRFVTPYPSLRVAVDNDRAIVAGYDSYRNHERHVTVLDVADPEAMTPLGTFRCAGPINDLEISGHFAYVADNGIGLRILDISKREAPTLVSTYDEVIPRDLAIWRNRAFLAYNQGLQILDISDPSTPRRVADVRGIGALASVVTDGHHAYVSIDTTGFQVIDVSDPAAPSPKGSYNAGRMSVQAIARDHLYLLNRNQLQIFNVVDPSAPVPEGTYYFAESALSLDVVGEYAVVAAFSYQLGRSGIQLFDISDPLKPTLAGSYSTPGFIKDACAYRGHVYVADFDAVMALSLELNHGDANGDGTIAVSDARYLANYLLAAGPSPQPTLFEGDVNCSGNVDLIDLILLVNHILRGGPPPC